jgi:hypothetical protein
MVIIMATIAVESSTPLSANAFIVIYTIVHLYNEDERLYILQYSVTSGSARLLPQ